MTQMKSKIYLLLILSFLLLLVSLSYSLTNINNNTEIIEKFRINYLRLSSKITDLNYKIKKNQADMLQSILLQEQTPQNYSTFVALLDEINKLAKKDIKLDSKFLSKILNFRT